MNPISKLLLAGGLCLIAPLAVESGDKKAEKVTSVPLVTSDFSAETAGLRGAEVLRAVAASEPAIVDRHAAHMSTRMGKIEGGGIVIWASFKQKFSVSQVLARGGKPDERAVAYSYRERAQGFPLPRPTRAVAKGERLS